MNRQQYIQKILNKTHFSREDKRRLRDDLESGIDARLEQGQSFEEVMREMGPPSQVAGTLKISAGQMVLRRQGRSWRWAFAVLALAILCAGVRLYDVLWQEDNLSQKKTNILYVGMDNETVEHEQTKEVYQYESAFEGLYIVTYEQVKGTSSILDFGDPYTVVYKPVQGSSMVLSIALSGEQITLWEFAALLCSGLVGPVSAFLILSWQKRGSIRYFLPAGLCLAGVLFFGLNVNKLQSGTWQAVSPAFQAALWWLYLLSILVAAVVLVFSVRQIVASIKKSRQAL